MNRIQTKGFVLQRRDYGEADRILLLLTENGYIDAFARGVRRLKSKLASGIEVFTETDFVLIEGKSDLLTLSSAKPLKTYNSITQDYDRLQVGYELLKTLVAIKASDDTRVFTVTKIGLEYLNSDESVFIAELWFGLRILQLLGQDPKLSEDQDGNKLIENQRYYLHPDSGSLVDSETDAAVFDADGIKLWRLALDKSPGFLGAINGADEAAQKTLPALREFMQYHLG